MRLRRVLTLSLVALALAGCARRAPVHVVTPASSVEDTAPVTAVPKLARVQPVVVAAPVVVPAPAIAPIGYAPAPALTDEKYQLDSGDRLRVVVFGQEGISNSYAVDANGSITMPLIGAVKARGLSTAELSQAIAARLRQGFIRDPHVAVEVEVYRPFFILGEVTFPGQYPYVAHMTVETAVAIAGGFTPRTGTPSIARVILNSYLQARGVVPPIYPVQPGDTIHVSERWF